MTANSKDKVIVITGASSGMGETAARYLAEKGAHVIVAACRSDRIDVLAADINKRRGERQ